jgi:Cu+-exporting ATPase
VRLTGDNAHTARAVAAEVGIEDVIADVLRADKAAFVRRLQEGEAPHRACALEEDAPGEEAEEAEASRPLRVIAPFTLARPGWRSAI